MWVPEKLEMVGNIWTLEFYRQFTQHTLPLSRDILPTGYCVTQKNFSLTNESEQILSSESVRFPIKMSITKTTQVLQQDFNSNHHTLAAYKIEIISNFRMFIFHRPQKTSSRSVTIRSIGVITKRCVTTYVTAANVTGLNFLSA